MLQKENPTGCVREGKQSKGNQEKKKRLTLTSIVVVVIANPADIVIEGFIEEEKVYKQTNKRGSEHRPDQEKPRRCNFRGVEHDQTGVEVYHAELVPIGFRAEQPIGFRVVHEIRFKATQEIGFRTVQKVRLNHGEKCKIMNIFLRFFL